MSRRLSPLYIERLQALLEEVFAGEGPHNAMLAKMLTDGLRVEPDEVFAEETLDSHLQALTTAMEALEQAVQAGEVRLTARPRA